MFSHKTPRHSVHETSHMSTHRSWSHHVSSTSNFFSIVSVYVCSPIYAAVIHIVHNISKGVVNCAFSLHCSSECLTLVSVGVCQGPDCWITMHGFTTKSHHQVSGKVGLPRYQQSLVLASVFPPPPLPPSPSVYISVQSPQNLTWLFPEQWSPQKSIGRMWMECLRHWKTAQRTHTDWSNVIRACSIYIKSLVYYWDHYSSIVTHNTKFFLCHPVIVIHILINLWLNEV